MATDDVFFLQRGRGAGAVAEAAHLIRQALAFEGDVRPVHLLFGFTPSRYQTPSEFITPHLPWQPFSSDFSSLQHMHLLKALFRVLLLSPHC